MKHFILTFTFLACCIHSISVWAAYDNGGISGAKVHQVTVLTNGEFHVTFDKGICDEKLGNKSGGVYRHTTPDGVKWTKEGAEMMLRTVLAAKLSGATLKVFADNTNHGKLRSCPMGAVRME